MPKHAWLRVDGVLLLDKPPAISSNDALQRVRRAYRAKKAGHGGTLDPLATGLLPIAFGAATRFLHDLVEADKRYTATIRLGECSSTGDGEGELTPTPGYESAVPRREQVLAVLAAMQGPIMQRAPMFSALKHEGRPLYEYARAGITITRPDRPVTLHALELEHLDVAELRIRVHCSKGTYIRVLAEDIGAALGTGAWLSGLRRDAVGEFGLATAHKLADIDAARAERTEDDPHRGLPALAPVDAMVQNLPLADLDAEAARRFMHGQPITPRTALVAEGRWRVYTDGRFLGLGRRDGALLNPERVVADP